MEGFKGFCFIKKLQRIKHKLWKWNRNTFGRIKEKKDLIWSEVYNIDQKIEEDGALNPVLKTRRNQMLVDMESILY